MSEILLWQLLLLFIATMQYPVVFIAAVMLLVAQELTLVPFNEIAISAAAAIALPGITTFNFAAYTSVYFSEGGWLLMIFLLLLFCLPLCLYILSGHPIRCPWFDINRCNRSGSAMLIVYAVLLLFVAYSILTFVFTTNFLVALIIFLIAFFLTWKLRLPLIIVALIGIVIALLLL